MLESLKERQRRGIKICWRGIRVIRGERDERMRELRKTYAGGGQQEEDGRLPFCNFLSLSLSLSDLEEERGALVSLAVRAGHDRALRTCEVAKCLSCACA